MNILGAIFVVASIVLIAVLGVRLVHQRLDILQQELDHQTHYQEATAASV